MNNNVGFARFTLSLSVLIFSGLAFSGCSLYKSPTDIDLQKTQYAGGYISLNRVAPPVASPATLLGFMPDSVSDKDSIWLKVELAENKLVLMKGSNVVDESKIEGVLPLQPGVYSVQHKQRSPLWYAGDEYFSLRGLAVPSIGDKERYRRGALGDFALFVDSDASIHSAPVWTEEVGGLRIDDEKMKKIYYSLDVGAKVQVIP
jgi:hypothetical protein